MAFIYGKANLLRLGPEDQVFRDRIRKYTGNIAMKEPAGGNLPLFIPHSSTTTAHNKTGSWRFFHPKYEEKTAPCSAACPLGQDIARIEMLASRRLFKDAWHLILEENPLPAVCGRVCFHPCERSCNRSKLDAPVAVRHLERFLGDAAAAQSRPANLDSGLHQDKQDKRIAIAGAGPAGLSAAYFLTRLGYGCDVYETQAEPGGLLRSAIPVYRLPRDVLDHEIHRIRALGVNFFCRKPITPGLLDKIVKDYDALFIGCGYARPITLNIEAGHLAHDGLALLQRLPGKQKVSFSGKAAVIGGGNTAIDVARSLARLGADPMIIYRRRVEDMPAFEPEIKMAIAEGVSIMELAAPIGIRQNQTDSASPGNSYSLCLQQMKVGGTEAGGRARVVPDGKRTRTIEVQEVFVAIGAEAEPLWQLATADTDAGFNFSHCRLINRQIPFIFGGDLTSPAKSVTDAIASGKQAAMVLSTYFENGLEAVESSLAACRVGPGPALSMNAFLGSERRGRSAQVVSDDQIVMDYFQSAPRVNPKLLDAGRRRCSFAEIESGLNDEAAVQEATRCFNCGICNACDYCRLYCPEMAVKVQKAQRSIDMDYCKGCGVCATECPRNAMALEEEIK